MSSSPTPRTEAIADAPELHGPVMMEQAWRDAAFLHWAVPPERVAHLMPPGVRPDVGPGPSDAVTYVALVPFRMVGAGLGPREVGPAVPWAGTFLETNVRLYSVDDTGRRGIVFLTLECSRLVVVAGARAAFGLPYRWSSMAFGRRAGGRDDGAGQRLAYALRGRGARSHLHQRLELSLGAQLSPTEAHDDHGLPRFLTARWGLHQQHVGRTWYVPNEHGPWPLRTATVEAFEDTLLADVGFPDLAEREPDSVLFSSGVVTRFGLPGDARRPRRG
ncbi:YqjF family protein [Quadrisphaera sp. KR29]|uniref:YqjF family protein n=1 Tax=Quadrisphaera sp. KR29 TaxID=3461391 RepID=UPI004044E2F7